jgi:colicin import membrane protein
MEPSLRTTAAVSLVIHIVFFATIVIIMNSRDHFIRPLPYVVRLVGSDVENSSSTAKTDTATQTQQSSDKSSSDAKTVSDDAKEYAEDRIAALKAKKKAADAVKLRTTIISLKGSTSDKTNTEASKSVGGGGGGGIETNYIMKISEEIRQHWAFPEIKGKNFEAIIAVTITKDGTIIMHNIEKSSGDSLFDGSALRAIKKASPVTPPPYEMNFGMRFIP